MTAEKRHTLDTDDNRAQVAYALRTHAGEYGRRLADQVVDRQGGDLESLPAGSPDDVTRATYALRAHGGELGRAVAAELDRSGGEEVLDLEAAVAAGDRALQRLRQRDGSPDPFGGETLEAGAADGEGEPVRWHRQYALTLQNMAKMPAEDFDRLAAAVQSEATRRAMAGEGAAQNS